MTGLAPRSGDRTDRVRSALRHTREGRRAAAWGGSPRDSGASAGTPQPLRCCTPSTVPRGRISCPLPSPRPVPGGRKGQLRVASPGHWQASGEPPLFRGGSRPGGKLCLPLGAGWAELAPTRPGPGGQGGAQTRLPRSLLPRALPGNVLLSTPAPQPHTGAHRRCHRRARYSLNRLMFSVNLRERRRGEGQALGARIPDTPTAEPCCPPGQPPPP